MKKRLSLILLLVIVLSAFSLVACEFLPFPPDNPDNKDNGKKEEGTFGSFEDIYTQNAYLGYGINIIDASAVNSKNVKMQYAIFDSNQLMKETLLKEKDTESLFQFIEGSNIAEFCANLSNSTSVSSGSHASAKGQLEGVDVEASASFSNGLKTAFTIASSTVQSQYFMRVMAENKRYSLVLQSTEKRYKEMLSDEFKADLYDSSVSPSRLFEKYGTHLLTSVVMGGNIYMDYTMYSYDSETTVDSYIEVVRKYQENAGASFGKDYSASIGDNVSFENAFTYKSVAKEKNIEVKNTVTVVGGASAGITNEKTFYEQYHNWQKTLDDTPVLIGIRDDQSLYPIWNLIDTSSTEGKNRQEELLSYFQQYGWESYQALCDKYQIKSSEDVKTIYDLSGLQEIAKNPNGNYKLMSDIKIDGQWTPIEVFSGTLDGNGKKIYNFQIKKEDGKGSASVGFIGTNNGTIKNLIIGNEDSNPYTNGRSVLYSIIYSETSNKSTQTLTVGGIAGTNNGTIDGCKIVNAHIYSQMSDIDNDGGACLYMGGISGVNSCEGIIYHCEVYNSELEGSMPVAENSGDDNYGCVGGICAINEGNISYCSTADCILDLDVYGDGYEKLFDLNKAYPHAIVGGIVAEHDSDVRLSQCLSSGNSIKMYASKGGYTEPTTIGGTIIGVLKTGELHECYAKVGQTITITTTKDGPVIVDYMIGRGESSGCKSFSDESELPDYFNDLLPNETDN